MRLEGISAAVTGGASGLGLATARKMIKAGAQVTLIDLPGSAGAQVAQELGDAARFVAADVTDEQQFASALDAAGETGPLRALVHCAGGFGVAVETDRVVPADEDEDGHERVPGQFNEDVGCHE